jgi:hypothetical protein
MKTTIGLVIALMLGGASAYAQGGPPEKMQGPPAMRDQGPGDAGVRGNDGAPTQSREGRAPAQPGAKEDRGGKQAQTPEEKGFKGRSDKGNQPARAEKEEKGGKPPENRAEDRSRSDKGKPPQAAEDGKSAPQPNQSAEKKPANPQGEPGKQATAGEHSADAAKRVDLSGDKRDRIKTAFREKSDVKHYTNVNIDLRVGTRLPRDFVFVPVPIAVIDIVPEYRGYYFAYVDDDYVICDPDTYEIVAIIPVSGGPSYASDHSAERCPDRLSLSADEKDFIAEAIRHEDRGRKVDVHHLSVGWSVPREVELQRFPDPVISQVGELSSCRYFVAQDQIAIVSPDNEKVVLLIDRS